MGQDAADALDLREAQVLTDPDGQGVEPPQDQPGGHSGAQQHAVRAAVQLSRPQGGPKLSELTQPPAGGAETAQITQQGWARPGLLRDRAIKPGLEQTLPVQQDLDGESFVSAQQSRASRTLQSAGNACWVPTPSWQHLHGWHLSAGLAQHHRQGAGHSSVQ